MRLLLFLIIRIAAADPTTVAIEQAQSFALKKDRVKAVATLNEAIDAEGGKPRKALVEALDKIGKVFFTDKGQKLFESGQAIMYSTPDLAISQLRESLNLEGDNVAVLTALARVQIDKQDCKSASESLSRARETNPYAAEPALLELRARICAHDFEAFRLKLKSLPPLGKDLEPAAQYLIAEDLMQQKLWRKAHENLLKITAALPDFPEAYYLLNRTALQLGKDGDAQAGRYISLCKNLTARVRRKFAFEPRLCANAKEVEDEMAKKSNDDI